MARSLGLGLYLATSALAYGVARQIVLRRLGRGKEHETRYKERLGFASLPRPEGSLIWMHAASVGEAVSLLDLLEKLLTARPGLNILVTTGTVTSASLLETRLPKGAFHQFVPVDAAQAVKRFLQHWKPDVAVWTESELWPALIYFTHKGGCPMYLVNARISEKSTRRMRRTFGLARSLLNLFSGILAQDKQISDRFKSLGAESAKLEVTGSLKENATALPVDADELKRFSSKLAGKQVWLAASTHPGEEKTIAEAHRHARRVAHGLILILAPRHPERGDELAAELRAEGWRIAQRSREEDLGRDTEIYLADTLGEMGLWYRLAPLSFVGGSLVDIGGHNPYEPALLGSAIMHGAHVYNFETAYARLAAADASIRIPQASDLGRLLVESLPANRAAILASNAWQVTSESSDVARHLCDMLLSHVPETPSQ